MLPAHPILWLYDNQIKIHYFLKTLDMYLLIKNLPNTKPHWDMTYDSWNACLRETYLCIYFLLNFACKASLMIKHMKKRDSLNQADDFYTCGLSCLWNCFGSVRGFAPGSWGAIIVQSSKFFACLVGKYPIHSAEFILWLTDN